MEISFKQANSKNYIKGRTKGIEYIVLHYTANFGDTAKNNADYFARETPGVSAHYFCDETSIWNSVYDSDRAQHCGGPRQSSFGGAFYGKCTNGNSIGIEMCIYDKKGNIRYGTIETAAALTRQLMATYGVPESKVIRHYDVTGKLCPAPMVENEALWKDFKKKLSAEPKEEEMKIYTSIDAMPEWARSTFKKLIDKGYVSQDANGKIGVYESSLQPMVYLDRLTGGQLEKLPELIGIKK